MQAKAPVRLRPTHGDLIGTTAFFRNRAFLRQLSVETARCGGGGRTVRVLVHACSIGAEAYSLAINLRLRYPSLKFHIDATDVSTGFRDFAANGVYQDEHLAGLTADERACFEARPDGALVVGADVRSHVDFLPAASFVDFEADAPYDVVTVCNALVYVDAEGQSRTLDRIAAYNTGVLAVTAHHRGTIAQDLERNGYRPVMEGFEAIHAGWIDRLRPPGQVLKLTPNIKADPYIDPIDDKPGWRYRHGALFVKDAAAAAARDSAA